MPNSTDHGAPPPFDLDHVGFAVDDAATMLRRLHADGLLLPVAGEEDGAFRYVIGRREELTGGVRVEVLDPCGNADSFLARFLRQHGQGAHHLTFTVADLEHTLELVRAVGMSVVHVDLSYPPWREAFIHPRSGIGTVIQLASSIYTYPAGGEIGGPVDPLRVPHRRIAVNRDWWRAIVDDSTAAEPVVVEGLTMAVPEASPIHELFGQALGGQPGRTQDPGHHRYTWPSGYIDVVQSPQPHIALHVRSASDGTPRRYTIGNTVLSSRDNPTL